MTESSKRGAGQEAGAQAGAESTPTAAELAEAYPEAAQALRTEGAQSERERIQAVEAQALPGHEALVDQLRLDGKTTGPEAAVQILQAEQARKAKTGEDLTAEGEELDSVPGAHSEAGEVATAGGGKPKGEPATFGERVQQEWDANADNVQAEFSSFEAYKACREREEQAAAAG